MSSNYIEYAIKILSEDKYISYNPNDNNLSISDDIGHSNWRLDPKEINNEFNLVDIYIDNIDIILSYDSNDNVIYYEDFDISGKWILEDLGSDLYIIRTSADINKVISVEEDILKIVDITYNDNQKFKFIKK